MSKARVLICLFIFSPAVLLSVVFISSVTYARDIYSGVIPNDSYFLTRNGNITNDCLDSAGNPVCNGTTGYEETNRVNGVDPTSHQYVTIGNSINDDNRSGAEADYFKKIFFTVFTRSKPDPNRLYDVTVYLVDRGIGPDRACDGYSLQTSAIGPDKYNPSSGQMEPQTYPSSRKMINKPSDPKKSCGDLAPVRFSNAIPGSYFSELAGSNGYASGQYQATFLLKLNNETGSLNKQASFHIRSEVGNIGYKKTDDVANGYYWVNTYPTKNSRDHKLKYYFRPPCRGERTMTIRLDDLSHPLQSGNISVHINQITPNGTDTSDVGGRVNFNYNLDSGSLGSTNNLSINAGPGQVNGGTLTFTGAEDGQGRPYGYVLIIEGVAGGNGLSVSYPTDSGNVWLRCASTGADGWEANNKTVNKLPYVVVNRTALPSVPSVNKPINYYEGRPCTDYNNATNRSNCNTWNDYYTARSAAWAANANAVRNALQRTNYTHYVSNISPNGQEAWVNSSTNTTIQYKFKLANGADRNGRNGNTDWRDRYNSASFANSTAPRATNAVRSADTPVSVSNSNETYDEMMSEPRGDGGAASDMYCERALTTRTGSPTGSSLGSVRDNTSATNYTDSAPQCVYLCVNAPGNNTCVEPCEDWTVSARAEMRVRGASDWIYPGVSAINDAQVGITYDSWFVVTNNGKRDTTPGITGKMYKYTAGDAVATGDGDMPGSPRSISTSSEYGFERNSILVSPRDGGKTFVSYGDFSPSSSAPPNNCGQTGTVTPSPETRLTVPYYFNITPSIGSISPATEQGQDINMSASYNLPVDDGAGRQHTWTDDTQYKITELINPTSQTALGDNSSGDVCGQYAHGGCREVAGDRDHIEPGSGSLGTMGRSGADTASLPVGTNICYLASLNRPTHNADPSWRHTGMVCTKIIKKPKVQFRGGDLTVGRYRKDGDNCTRAPLSGAVIQASGASSANPYGSWIEYGAFATGNITGFGSGAFPYGNTGDNYKRLLFANTTSTPGNYVYGSGSKCLSDPFTVINSDYNTIDVDSIRPGDYFAANTDDKEGYVREGDLTLGEPAAEAAGGGTGTDTASTGAQYVVQQCYGETNTVPSGWSATGGGGSSMSRSSGCNGDGGNHRLRVYWDQDSLADSGASIGWRYSTPSGSELVNVRADRYRTLGVSWNYSDPFAVTGTNSCTRYFEGAGVDGTCTAHRVDSIDQNLSGTTFDFNIYCSVNLVTGENGGKCNSGGTPTSIGLSNIRITMKDTTSPGVTVDGGSLKGPKVSGKDARLSITGTDTGSGVYGYVLKAYGPGLPAAGKVLKDEKFDSEATCIASPVTTPTPCSSTKTKEMSVDTTQSGFVSFGVYTFTVQTRDQAGNTSAVRSWDATVDNRQLLGADYNAFKNRNVVVWARKDGDKACGESGAGGNININTDITYKIDGYSNISELPRIIFMADCDIVIDDSVQTVSAWLVAKKDIYTCSRTIANYFSPENTDTSRPNQADCNKQLTINGAIQANRLHLLRTYGSDQTTAEKGEPAETFNLRADQVLSTWAKGQTSGSPRTIYQSDDNPNF